MLFNVILLKCFVGKIQGDTIRVINVQTFSHCVIYTILLLSTSFLYSCTV